MFLILLPFCELKKTKLRQEVEDPYWVCVCLCVRSLSIEQQQGDTQCSTCQRWFCSKGGLAVHRFTAAKKMS